MKDKVYHIGRNKNSNEIFISNDTVSSVHAQIIIDDENNLIIIDLSSKNGVYINNIKVNGPSKINKNDIVSIGMYKFTKMDLLNSVKEYDYNNSVSENKNVHLNSSLSTNNNFRILKNNFKLTKILTYLILIILVFLLSFFIYDILKNQKSLKSIIDSKSESEVSLSENKSKENIQKSKIIVKQRDDISYDFSCLENEDGSNVPVMLIGDLTRNIQSGFLKDIDISLEDEQEYGDDVLDSFKKEYEFIKSGKELKKLKNITSDLTSRILNPRGFKYEVFLINDTIKNVFTSGGNIFFFKGMYDNCINSSEMASIISHEISHNELGHLILDLKKKKSVKRFGFFGNIIVNLESFITQSFDQKQETEADLFGMDLMYPTNYKNCSAVDFWNRTSVDDNDYNQVDNFLRSHPYSNKRAECLKNHLFINYNLNCE